MGFLIAINGRLRLLREFEIVINKILRFKWSPKNKSKKSLKNPAGKRLKCLLEFTFQLSFIVNN